MTDSSILKVEAADSSERLVIIYETIWCHIPENIIFFQLCRRRSYIYYTGHPVIFLTDEAEQDLLHYN
jgi:uncharacterized protein YvpB